MKYLVNYLRDYSLKHSRYPDYLDFKTVIDGNREYQVMVNEHILFEKAADRIEELEDRLKELEKIDRILKILESEGSR